MPSLITHHIFGEDAAQRLPKGLIDGEEELLAFLLGNEGPDPFFVRFSTIPARVSACRHLARDMHNSHVTRAFGDIRSSVGHLPVEDERIGRAFALGLLGHYALDRTAHPFIYAQQYALLEQPGLADAPHELHAIIESDIDSWILWEKRHATVLEHHPASDLMHTARIDRVGGTIFSQVAFAVFGLNVGPEEYGAAVSDYQWVYRRIEPAGSGKTRLIDHVRRVRLRQPGASRVGQPLHGREEPRKLCRPLRGGVGSIPADGRGVCPRGQEALRRNGRRRELRRPPDVGPGPRIPHPSFFIGICESSRRLPRYLMARFTNTAKEGRPRSGYKLSRKICSTSSVVSLW